MIDFKEFDLEEVEKLFNEPDIDLNREEIISLMIKVGSQLTLNRLLEGEYFTVKYNDANDKLIIYGINNVVEGELPYKQNSFNEDFKKNPDLFWDYIENELLNIIK